MSNESENKLVLLIKYKSTLIKLAVIVVSVLIIVLAVFFKGYTNAKEKYEDVIKTLEEENKRLSDPVVVHEVATKEVAIDLINLEIQDIGELATVEYLYTDAGKFEDPAKLFEKELPFEFTTKSFIAKWDGSIKVGIDVSKVIAEEDKTKKEIVVHIPKSKILSHEIDEKSIEILDEKDGLFNSINMDDYVEFNIVSKDAMEKRAIEAEVVEELGYTITFEMIEE